MQLLKLAGVGVAALGGLIQSSPSTTPKSSGTSAAGAAASADSPASKSSDPPKEPGSAPSNGGGGPYELVQSHEGETFFDGWDFWSDADPTHGQVDYVPQDQARSAGLISTSSSVATMKVDSSSTLEAGAQRQSVRIHSKEAVQIGSLIIADIVKMPFGCATWWMNGPNWPAGGEIDVLEGVHDFPANQITLHVVDSGCKLSESADVTGKLVPANDDCNANVKGNAGCSYAEQAANSYGKGFNDAGGGVFATSFTADAIDQWFWSRPDVPENIKSGTPDEAGWGKPTASWPSSSCEISKCFADQTMIFDTTLCGDWAGAVWEGECLEVAATCADAVKDPKNFVDAVWEVASVKVYSLG
ncbi:glycoside hydrolase family 16 protein [Rhodotorula paludigena]|uniref:glycoside hydrolase family 16 protein n=1 Tax=Rhodotorula paludigena TaxID=86838 RepID=UPI0031772621